MIKLDLTTIEVVTLELSATEAEAAQRTFVNACISDDCLTERTCNPVNC